MQKIGGMVVSDYYIGHGAPSFSGLYANTRCRGLADPDMPVIRYLLGDDGIIYELGGNLNELGSFNGGYGLYDDNGTKAIDSASNIFKVSENKDAQEEYEKILLKFN